MQYHFGQSFNLRFWWLSRPFFIRPFLRSPCCIGPKPFRALSRVAVANEWGQYLRVTSPTCYKLQVKYFTFQWFWHFEAVARNSAQQANMAAEASDACSCLLTKPTGTKRLSPPVRSPMKVLLLPVCLISAQASQAFKMPRLYCQSCAQEWRCEVLLPSKITASCFGIHKQTSKTRSFEEHWRSVAVTTGSWVLARFWAGARMASQFLLGLRAVATSQESKMQGMCLLSIVDDRINDFTILLKLDWATPAAMHELAIFKTNSKNGGGVASKLNTQTIKNQHETMFLSLISCHLIN